MFSGEMDKSRFELVFHGTQAPSARAILEHGFDPAKRAGQTYGPGEYFGELRIAQGYDKGAMLVCLVFTAASGVVKRASSEPKIIVVNNPTDRSETHCVPLGMFMARADAAEICRTLSVVGPTPTVQYVVDAGRWVAADPVFGREIAAARASGTTKVSVSFQQQRYAIDLSATPPTQRNKGTGKTRELRFV